MDRRRNSLVLVAIIAMVGCSSSKRSDPGASTSRPPMSKASTTTSNGVTTTNGETPTTTLRPRVDIAATPTVTAKEVDLQVVVDGVVPQLYDRITGRPVTGEEQVLNTRIDYGDGSPPVGSDGGSVVCRDGAPLVPLHMAWRGQASLTHAYGKPGRYTVTFSVRVCGLGTVTRHAEVSAS
jgi:hypothetical protein